MADKKKDEIHEFLKKAYVGEQEEIKRHVGDQKKFSKSAEGEGYPVMVDDRFAFSTLAAEDYARLESPEEILKNAVFPEQWIPEEVTHHLSPLAGKKIRYKVKVECQVIE